MVSRETLRADWKSMIHVKRFGPVKHPLSVVSWGLDE
jgi:hypothetical protein